MPRSYALYPQRQSVTSSPLNQLAFNPSNIAATAPGVMALPSPVDLFDTMLSDMNKWISTVESDVPQLIDTIINTLLGWIGGSTGLNFVTLLTEFDDQVSAINTFLAAVLSGDSNSTINTDWAAVLSAFNYGGATPGLDAIWDFIGNMIHATDDYLTAVWNAGSTLLYDLFHGAGGATLDSDWQGLMIALGLEPAGGFKDVWTSLFSAGWGTPVVETIYPTQTGSGRLVASAHSIEAKLPGGLFGHGALAGPVGFVREITVIGTDPDVFGHGVLSAIAASKKFTLAAALLGHGALSGQGGGVFTTEASGVSLTNVVPFPSFAGRGSFTAAARATNPTGRLTGHGALSAVVPDITTASFVVGQKFGVQSALSGHGVVSAVAHATKFTLPAVLSGHGAFTAAGGAAEGQITQSLITALWDALTGGGLGTTAELHIAFDDLMTLLGNPAGLGTGSPVASPVTSVPLLGTLTPSTSPNVLSDMLTGVYNLEGDIPLIGPLLQDITGSPTTASGGMTGLTAVINDMLLLLGDPTGLGTGQPGTIVGGDLPSAIGVVSDAVVNGLTGSSVTGTTAADIANAASQVVGQISNAVLIAQESSAQIANQAVNTQGFQGVDSTLLPVFPLTSITGNSASTITASQTASAIGFINIPVATTKYSAVWYGGGVTNVNEMFVNIYSVNLSTGALTAVWQSENIVSAIGSSPDWVYIPIGTPVVMAQGSWWGVEVQITGPGGSHTMVGIPNHWLNTPNPNVYPSQLAATRQSVVTPTFDAAGVGNTGTATTTTTVTENHTVGALNVNTINLFGHGKLTAVARVTHPVASFGGYGQLTAVLNVYVSGDSTNPYLYGRGVLKATVTVKKVAAALTGYGNLTGKVSQTIAGTNVYLLVFASAFATGGNHISTFTATYNGVAMQQLTNVNHNNTAADGQFAVFGLQNCGSGTGTPQTVSVTATASAAVGCYVAVDSVSYDNVGTLGVVSDFTGSGASPSWSATGLGGCLTVGTLSEVSSIGAVSISAYNKTQRANISGTGTDYPALAIGDTSSLGAISFTATGNNTTWAATSIVLSGAPSAPATIPSPVYSNNIPWIALSSNAAETAGSYAPQIYEYANPTSFTALTWANFMDLVGVGGGGSGQGEQGINLGQGGYGGIWNGVTLTAGIDFTPGETVFAVNPGPGGTPEITYFFNGNPGSPTTITWTDPFGKARIFTAAGGAGGSSRSFFNYAGRSPGDFAWPVSGPNLLVYYGGTGGVAGFYGNYPGGGGGGALPFIPASGGGAGGAAWLVSRQT